MGPHFGVGYPNAYGQLTDFGISLYDSSSPLGIQTASTGRNIAFDQSMPRRIHSLNSSMSGILVKAILVPENVRTVSGVKPITTESRPNF